MNKRYPSDLTDEEWRLVETVLPLREHAGRPRVHDYRLIVNAILYRQRTACSWRMLPHDLPPWQTVYDYYSRWLRDDTWQNLCLLINHP